MPWLFPTRRRYHESDLPVSVNNKKVWVECYSGAKADEYPMRFGHGDHGYVVEEVLDRWYGPDDAYFKVRANDGNIYILRHTPATDIWSLESFRRS